MCVCSVYEGEGGVWELCMRGLYEGAHVQESCAEARRVGYGGQPRRHGYIAAHPQPPITATLLPTRPSQVTNSASGSQQQVSSAALQQSVAKALNLSPEQVSPEQEPPIIDVTHKHIHISYYPPNTIPVCIAHSI